MGVLLILLFLSSLTSLGLTATTIDLNHGGGSAPELRGVWLTTAGNTDWPPARDYNGTRQQEALVGYLDALAAVNVNTVFFQIRGMGDAFYRSSLEPWSKLLAGKQGRPPYPEYDPLAFLIQQAESRGIQVHAWMNPYIANYPATHQGLAPNHIANRYPQYALKYSNYLWMDPGAKVITDHIRAVVRDVISRYSVRGIHFDDFFYPYPAHGLKFPDNATYRRYVDSGGRMSRGDWRRDNVNQLIRGVYGDVKAAGRVFSVSPFGLYRPGQPGGMPGSIHGLDPYSETYSDSKLWLQSGWVDALIPQLYWAIKPPRQSYPVLLDWWLSVNNASRLVCAGNAAYRLVPRKGDWSVSELTDQVTISRLEKNRRRHSLGNVWFSAHYFSQDYKNVSDVYRRTIYSQPAPVPHMGAP